MSQAFSPHQLAIPGPSVIPERVLRAMHRPSPNIYEGEIVELTASVLPDLKTVARATCDVAIYIANGHGAWEASLRNVVMAGDHVLVAATGRFAKGWAEMAEAMGVSAEIIDFGLQSDIDPQKIEERLRSDTEGLFRAVLIVQTDTSTSIRNDVASVRSAMDAAQHDALLMVDCIACLACDRFEMDAWGVDVMITGSQKGLMTPAGLSFVYFNERARQAGKRVQPGLYWDWARRVDPEVFYYHFCGTPPTHHLFGLREALDMIVHEEGLEACWTRHERIAKAVWAALDGWGDGGSIRHNISDPAKRSVAVSAVTMTDGHATQLRQWCEDHAGLTLGIGIGMAEPGAAEADNYFRIGHMGYQSVASTMAVLGAIETGLMALNVPHGEDALARAARVLSENNQGES